MLHRLLGIRTRAELDRHPKLGASWEGFALSNTIDALRADSRDCYFWATHSGAGLDLMVTQGAKRSGFEFKYSSAPTLTKSMQIPLDDLGLRELTVVHAGRESYRLAKHVHARPLAEVVRG